MFNHLQWLSERRRKIFLPRVRTLLHACWIEVRRTARLRVETLSGHTPLQRLPALPFPSRGLRRIHWFKSRPCHIAAGGPERVNICLQYALVVDDCSHSSRWHTGASRLLRGSGYIQLCIQPLLCWPLYIATTGRSGPPQMGSSLSVQVSVL